MTNKKSTKRALLVSAMAMVICFTMLLGTTFAWFTDNDEVANNVIAAGTLEVKLTANAVSLNNVEPGYVHVQSVNIENAGSLDFNYKLVLNRTAAGTAKDLADVIEVYYFTGVVTPTRAQLVNTSAAYLGTLSSLVDGTDDFFGARSLNDGTNEDITLVYVVPGESVGNEYQEASAGTFTIKVLAAQKASESDSLGTDYDAGSKYENGDLAN